MNIDITPALISALLEERHYWREVAAIRVNHLTMEMAGTLPRQRSKTAVRRDLEEACCTLQAAIDGDFFPACESCGYRIFPGQVCIPCTDVELHADCTGHAIPAGAQIKIDPESVEVEEGETYPGYVVTFAHERLYTEERIAEYLAQGQAAAERRAA